MTRFLDRLQEIVERRTGLDVSTLGGMSAIEKAAMVCQGDSMGITPERWLASLEVGDVAWQRFLHQIIVPETFFFRYPESFEALIAWVKRHGPRPVRVLSMPCSTGEETYSIAISLCQAGLQPHEFSVVGTDINERSVKIARNGHYQRASSFRSRSPEIDQRFFDTQKNGVSVTDFLRKQVTFTVGNFWEAHAQEEPYDAVFCRNLLIYFSADRQVRALQKLDSLLKPEGLLFLGPAEVPLATQKGWTSAGYSMSFACRRATSQSTVVSQVFRSPDLSKLPKTELPAARRSVVVAPVTVAPTVNLPPSEPVTDRDPLRKIRQMADRGEIEEAGQALTLYLRSNEPDAEAYFLQGLLADVSGESAAAERHFRKALYLEPDHREALSHLAWLLRNTGRVAASKALLARADRYHSS